MFCLGNVGRKVGASLTVALLFVVGLLAAPLYLAERSPIEMTVQALVGPPPPPVMREFAQEDAILFGIEPAAPPDDQLDIWPITPGELERCRAVLAEELACRR
jgi:hypothetical protein